jgi:hypothetical protein
MRESMRPVFVVGVPRSGTTVIGAFVGSADRVLDLGEYGGFYFSHRIASSVFRRLPGPSRSSYLRSLREHAAEFACKTARDRGASSFCDSTPWNLLITNDLIQEFPDALFVLVVRHYSGAIQSLARSADEGYEWAGSNDSVRARLWSQFYSNAVDLPVDRTVVVSYDSLCAKPQPSIEGLRSDLSVANSDLVDLDVSVFATSHATQSSRPAIAVNDGSGLRFQSVPSFNRSAWSAEIEASVGPLVAETDQALKDRFGARYAAPTEWDVTIA